MGVGRGWGTELGGEKEGRGAGGCGLSWSTKRTGDRGKAPPFAGCRGSRVRKNVQGKRGPSKGGGVCPSAFFFCFSSHGPSHIGSLS